MLHQGGFERVCVATARLLLDTYDVTIAIFSDEDIAFDISGLRVINIDVPAKAGKLNKIINVLKRVHKMKSLKRKMNPDVSYSFGPTANLVNVLSKVGNTSTWTGIRSYMDMDQPGLLKLFVSKSDKVICCSKEITSEIKTKYNCQCAYTLYNLYDVNKMEQEAIKAPDSWPFGEDKRYTLIAMGREDDIKCYDHMLKAFKLAHDKCSKAKLVILGEGEFTEYKELVSRLGIEDSVYFAGMRTDPYSYLARSGIYVISSFNEGFPNSLVEGMALGCAAVSTNCKTGPAEILIKDENICVAKAKELIDDNDGLLLSDYGLLVSVMSKEKNLDETKMSEEIKLSEALIKLLLDDELYEKYSNIAKIRAHEFSYEAYKNKFISMFDECTTGNN